MATNIIMQHEADSLMALMFVFNLEAEGETCKIFYSSWIYGTKFLLCTTLWNKVSVLHDFTEQSFYSAWLYGTKFLMMSSSQT